MKRSTPRLRHMLPVLCLLFAACEGCGGGSESPSWSNITIEGEQTQPLIVPAHTRVIVTADLSFNTAVRPALVIQGEAEFLSAPGVSILLPDSILFPDQDEVRFMARDSDPWRGLVFSGVHLQASNVVVENAISGLNLHEGASALLEDCSFNSCIYYGLEMNIADTVIVRNCTFSGMEIGIYAFRDCAFVELDGCEVTSCVFGVRANRSTFEVRNCLFRNNSEAAIRFHQEGFSTVWNNDFLDNWVHLYEQHCFDLDCQFNDFGSSGRYAMYFIYANEGHNRIANNSIALGGEGFYLRSDGGTVLAGGNWWGTTDSSLVRSRLMDSHYDVGLGVAEIAPVLSQPPAGVGRP